MELICILAHTTATSGKSGGRGRRELEEPDDLPIEVGGESMLYVYQFIVLELYVLVYK